MNIKGYNTNVQQYYGQHQSFLLQGKPKIMMIWRNLFLKWIVQMELDDFETTWSVSLTKIEFHRSKVTLNLIENINSNLIVKFKYADISRAICICVSTSSSLNCLCYLNCICTNPVFMHPIWKDWKHSSISVSLING